MKHLFINILLILSYLFFITACGEESEDGKYIYYKAMGEGYVYVKDTKEPAPYAYVVVGNQPWRTTGYGSHLTSETFIADEKGYFKVRFIKKYTGMSRIYRYSYVWAWNEEFRTGVNVIYFDKDFLKKQKQTFKIDTLWIEK